MQLYFDKIYAICTTGILNVNTTVSTTWCIFPFDYLFTRLQSDQEKSASQMAKNNPNINYIIDLYCSILTTFHARQSGGLVEEH